MVKLLASKRDIEKKIREEKQNIKGIHLKAFTLSDDMLESIFQELCNCDRAGTLQFEPDEVEDIEHRTLPLPQSKIESLRIAEANIKRLDVGANAPKIACDMAKCDLRDCTAVILVNLDRSPGMVHAYLKLSSKRSPMGRGAWMVLHELSLNCEDDYELVSQYFDHHASWYQHVFHFGELKIVGEQALASLDMCRVKILTDAFILQSGFIASVHGGEWIDNFIRRCPKLGPAEKDDTRPASKRKRSSASSGGSVLVAADDSEEWWKTELEEMNNTASFPSQKTSSSSGRAKSGTGASGGSGSTTELVPADAKDGVHAHVEQALVDLAILMTGAAGGSSAAAWDNFYCREMKGRWVAEHKGVAWDRFLCAAREGSPVWFCILYDLPHWKSWSRILYGDDGCVALGHECGRKLQYFYSLWEEAGCAVDYVFTADNLGALTEDLEWHSWASSVDIESEEKWEAMVFVRDAAFSC